MRIAIIDDEKEQREKLRKLILSHNCEFELFIDEYSDGESLIKSYQNSMRYDLIFTDIQMNILNGIETAREIRIFDKTVPIIIVTNFIDYSLQGYDIRAFKYLLKPLSELNFEEIFNQVLYELNWKENAVYKVYIQDWGIFKLNISDLLYVESMGRKVIFHLFKENVECYLKISDEAIKLSSFGFTRIHRSYIVNVRFIERILKETVILKNNAILPIGGIYYKPLLDIFTNFLARN